jgi:hypothetical protein
LQLLFPLIDIAIRAAELVGIAIVVVVDAAMSMSMFIFNQISASATIQESSSLTSKASVSYISPTSLRMYITSQDIQLSLPIFEPQ